MINEEFENAVKKNFNHLHPVVKCGDKRVGLLDLSKSNTRFSGYIYNNLERFDSFIKNELKTTDSSFLVGGYREMREMYQRSELFNSEEPRVLHLGTDIWGPEGSNVYAPLGGTIHSFADNNNFGDYGPTIILQHQLETVNFYTLYGHLSIADLVDKREGQFITRGERFARFGPSTENGNWPPHLHFQVIIDMGISYGDYPGVCRPSESAKYLNNSPDPALLLKW